MQEVTAGGLRRSIVHRAGCSRFKKKTGMGVAGVEPARLTGRCLIRRPDWQIIALNGAVPFRMG